jgi:sugar phosphate isomerase/epimerase
MPKYGLMNNPIKDVVSEINNFASLGFDYAEISIEEPCSTPRLLMKGKKRILAALSRNRMFAIGHTAYWVDFGTQHENVRKGWINEAKKMIATAKELNLGFLNFHFFPGNGSAKRIPKGRKAFLDNFTASMKELAAFAKGNNITLMLENMPVRDRKTAYRIKEFGHVIRNVPGLMVHLDVAHAFTEGGNRKIDEYMEKFSDKIVHVHVHDNHGKDDEHLPIGNGRIDFKRVVAGLKRINYDKTITFEVFTSDRDAQRSRKIFERIWKSA